MSQNPIFKDAPMMGVCYSPYHQEASKSFGSYTKADVAADMAIVKKHFSFIRTYGVSEGNQYVAECANAAGVQVALGTWITHGNAGQTNAEIDRAMAQANQYPDTVKVVVVGNEVDLVYHHNTVVEVKAAFAYALAQKAKYPNLANLPISICMTGGGAIADGWNQLLATVAQGNARGNGYVFLTIYPYYDPNLNPQNPLKPQFLNSMNWSHDNYIVAAQNAGLQVVIAEIGWPSSGNPPASSWPNATAEFGYTCEYIQGGNNYNESWVTMWFEMFDEPWKTDEGSAGPFFGLYGSGVNPQPKSGSGPLPICR